MNSENSSDYILNVWLATAIISPSLSCLRLFYLEPKANLILVCILIIIFSLLLSLPLYFFIKKISNNVYKIKRPNWVVKLILGFAVVMSILLAHLLFFHKAIIADATILSINGYSFSFFIALLDHAKIYLFIGIGSICYFKLERKDFIPQANSRPNILDDDFHSEK